MKRVSVGRDQGKPALRVEIKDALERGLRTRVSHTFRPAGFLLLHM